MAANMSTNVSGGSLHLTGLYPGLSFLGGELTGSITAGTVSPAVAVPEPDQYLTLLAGLGRLSVFARRRATRASCPEAALAG